MPGVIPVVVTLSTDVAPLDGFGLNVPIAPAGNPVIVVNCTAPVNPPLRVMFTV